MADLAENLPQQPMKRQTWRRFVPLRGLIRQRWQILFLLRKELLAPQRRTTFGLFWTLVLPIIPVTAYLLIRLIISSEPGPDAIHPTVYVTFGVTIWLMLRDMVRVPVESVHKYASTIANTELSVGGAVIVGFGGVLIDTMLRAAICFAVVFAISHVNGVNIVMTLATLGSATLFFVSIGLLSIPVAAVFPDLRNIYNTFFTYLIFFSLAIFPFSTDEGLGRLIGYNPFAVFIDAIRSNLLLGRMPEGSLVWVFSWASIGLFVVALFVLNRSKHRLPEAFQ